jgi:PKD repeat protein
MSNRQLRSAALAFVLLLIPAAALAQTELGVTVTTANPCSVATFSVNVEGGTGPYTLDWAFGDGETAQEAEVVSFPHETSHTYAAQGDYPWSVLVIDLDGLAGSAEGMISLAGPAVTLSSEPFPPLVSLEGGQATVQFTALVAGEPDSLSYAWDLDGDGAPDAGADPTSNTASFTYTTAGKHQATVTVTDGCGFVSSDTLTVLVEDPEAVACHPMAQRIADAVNALFPNQAEQLYTCEDIFDIFTGGLTGSQVGFGRLWHAYKLTQTMEDLTWEEIRDWHLDGNGWGLLVQLDRYAEAAGDVGLAQLVGMVVGGEASVHDIRAALRTAVHYGVSFEDALATVANGATPAQIGQAQRLAGEGGDWQAVLETGLKETRQQLREQRKEERSQERNRGHGPAQEGEPDEELGPEEPGTDNHQGQDQHTAERLAQQFGVSVAEVTALYDGSCGGDWSCVRAQLRQHTPGKPEDKGKDK